MLVYELMKHKNSIYLQHYINNKMEKIGVAR